MADFVLSAEHREATGKGSARKLRASGRIPAIVYGRDREPLPLSTDPRTLERLIQESDAGRNTLIDLHVAGRDDVVVIVKELQTDPIHGGLLHADFNVVDLTSTIQVSVPVHLVGIPTGVSQGLGILDHTLREIEVECLPRAIPDSIDIDVSALEIDDSIHVRDLAAPEGTTILSDGSLSVVSVVAPRAVEEEAAAAEAEAEAEGVEAEAAAEAKTGEEEARKKEGGE
ncbi:MAG: 50S ribosomal protein L25 [Deltaproteobacteria bacterium]|nr:MAG: 50S ribosomal protein L25 [Deltaproteobacteria bacterium]